MQLYISLEIRVFDVEGQNRKYFKIFIRFPFFHLNSKLVAKLELYSTYIKNPENFLICTLYIVLIL